MDSQKLMVTGAVALSSALGVHVVPVVVDAAVVDDELEPDDEHAVIKSAAAPSDIAAANRKRWVRMVSL